MRKKKTADTGALPGVPPHGANAAFWKSKTIEELAAEQGVSIPQDINTLLGAGEGLWANDAEFEAFLAILGEIRRGG